MNWILAGFLAFIFLLWLATLMPSLCSCIFFPITGPIYLLHKAEMAWLYHKLDKTVFDYCRLGGMSSVEAKLFCKHVRIIAEATVRVEDNWNDRYAALKNVYNRHKVQLHNGVLRRDYTPEKIKAFEEQIKYAQQQVDLARNPHCHSCHKRVVDVLIEHEKEFQAAPPVYEQ